MPLRSGGGGRTPAEVHGSTDQRRGRHAVRVEPEAWGVPLAVVAGIGFAIRLIWLVSNRHVHLIGDGQYYQLVANALAHGHGFSLPPNATNPRYVATGLHPPLYETYLAVWSRLGLGSAQWLRFASTVLGTGSIVVLASVGRRLGGTRVGLVAGLLVALDPNLWIWDGVLLSETMAVFVVALFLLAVVRELAEPSRAGLCLVAAAGALAGLARAELVLLVLAVVPLALSRTPLRGVHPARAHRWASLGAAALVAVLVLTPWAAYNQARFNHSAPLSTGLGLVLVGTDCPTTWIGSHTGYWDLTCDTKAIGTVFTSMRASGRPLTSFDESDADRDLRRIATRYVDHHPGRLPVVLAARLGRQVGLYRPVQQARLLSSSEHQSEGVGSMIMSTWYLLLALGVAGAVILRRAQLPLLALAAPIAAVVVVTLLTFALGRYRAPAEATLVLFAAIAVDAAARRWEGRAQPAPGSLLADATDRRDETRLAASLASEGAALSRRPAGPSSSG